MAWKFWQKAPKPIDRVVDLRAVLDSLESLPAPGGAVMPAREPVEVLEAVDLLVGVRAPCPRVGGCHQP